MTNGALMVKTIIRCELVLKTVLATFESFAPALWIASFMIPVIRVLSMVNHGLSNLQDILLYEPIPQHATWS